MASKEALEKEAAMQAEMQAERADLCAERDHAREEKSAVEATLASSMQALAIIRAARDEEKLAVMLVRKACVSLVYPTTQADDTEHQLRLGFSGEKNLCHDLATTSPLPSHYLASTFPLPIPYLPAT